MSYQFKRSLVGGTFDRFHLGHQTLLKTAFAQSEHVDVGIATDALFKEKAYAAVIEDFAIRKQTVEQFLFKNGFTNRFETIPIHDFYGTSLTDKKLDAIFITESNRTNVLKINEKRGELYLSPLEIVVVPYVYGNDDEIISSERIRSGEIDREGNSYAKLLTKQEQFVLPEHERNALREPIGTIYTEVNNVIRLLNPQTMLIAIGDIVSVSLMENGRQADISVIDGKTRRHFIDQSEGVKLFHMEGVKINNPAGTITHSAVESLQKALAAYDTTHKKQLIVVSGEEDLLAIPSILLSPLQAVVVYGQFDKGIVVVEVSEQNKKYVQDLFGKFQ